MFGNLHLSLDLAGLWLLRDLRDLQRWATRATAATAATGAEVGDVSPNCRFPLIGVSKTQMLHVWNIYLQNWAFFQVNVGKCR